MQLIVEARRHTEISSDLAYSPEQIGFLVLASPDRLALGGDELDGYEIVESQTLLSYHAPQTASDVEPLNSGARYYTASDCQAVPLGLAIEFAPCDAALRPHPPVLRLDANLLHRGQVDHQAAINGGTSRYVVATSADRHFETELLCEPDGIGHVGRVSALRDQCRAFVHEPVVDFSCFLVGDVSRLQKVAAERLAKLYRRSGNRSDCRHDTLVLCFTRLLLHRDLARSKHKEFS